MTNQAKQSDNSASGQSPRLEERFGKAGSAFTGAVKSAGKGIGDAVRAFKGVSQNDLVGFAERTVERGADFVRPIGKRVTDFVEEVTEEVRRELPEKPFTMQLNEFCQKNKLSRPSYQVTTEKQEGAFESLFVVSVVSKDRDHRSQTSRKFKAPLRTAAMEEAADDLLKKLKKLILVH